MKVLLAGDTHGNGYWFRKLCATAQHKGAEWIVQLGDFGYWEHRQHGRDFLEGVSFELEQHGLRCVFIDGNHENHTKLRADYCTDVPADEETGFQQIRPHLFYAMRGHRWTWDTVSFLALGGAYSVDKDPFPGWRGRKEGESWWPEETITDEEVELCVAGGRADVMLTHDCPYGVDIPTLRGTVKDRYPLSVANRERVKTVVRAVRPQALFCGHYHERHTAFLDQVHSDNGQCLDWHRTQVDILAHDGAADSSAILLLDLTDASLARA